MLKIWWHGEPLIVDSLRWRVINNDLRNNIKKFIEQLKALDEHTRTTNRNR